MQFFIEFMPLLLALLAYVKFDIYAATIVLMVTLPMIPIGQKLMGKPVSQLHIWSAVLVIVFGSLTLVLRNPLFIMWKPTVFYSAMAILIVGAQVVTKRPVMNRVLGGAMSLIDADWMRLGWIWAAFFVFMGGLNLAVAYNVPEATWFQFKVWGLTGLTLLFVIAQSLWLAPRILTEESN